MLKESSLESFRELKIIDIPGKGCGVPRNLSLFVIYGV